MSKKNLSILLAIFLVIGLGALFCAKFVSNKPLLPNPTATIAPESYKQKVVVYPLEGSSVSKMVLTMPEKWIVELKGSQIKLVSDDAKISVTYPGNSDLFTGKQISDMGTIKINDTNYNTNIYREGEKTTIHIPEFSLDARKSMTVEYDSSLQLDIENLLSLIKFE